MAANQELDEDIAVRVMGLASQEWGPKVVCPYCWQLGRYCGARSWCSNCSEWYHSAYKYYQDDLSDAMEVVEKMLGAFTFDCGSYDGRTWQVTFHSVEKILKREPGSAVNEIARTLPEAICRAALAAINTQGNDTLVSSGATVMID